MCGALLCAAALIALSKSSPATAADLAIAAYLEGIEQPITRHADGALTTEVYVNDSGPYPFLVDTGAARSTILASAVEEDGLHYSHEGTRRMIGADGTQKIRILKFNSLETKTAKVTGPKLVEIPDNDLHKFNTFRGILGADHWSDFTVHLDMVNDRMVLYPSNRDLAAEFGGSVHVIPLKQTVRDNALLAYVTINNRRTKALIDTGASRTIINKKFADRLSLEPEKEGRQHLVGLFGGKLEIAPLAGVDIKLGDKLWQGKTITVAQFDKAGTRGASLVIGMDLLGKSSITIDYSRRRLLLSRAEVQVLAQKP